MTRPHEDLERHTPTDHRPGGAPVTFAPGTWCAIDVAHVKADRIDAGLSAYETLIEKARTSAVKAHGAAILRSVNNRRVIALVGINGHDAFRHLKTAWDDHHLSAERHAVAESSTLALYQVAAGGGHATIDPASHDSYALEHVARDPAHVRALTSAIATADGFRGLLVFGTDDATAYRGLSATTSPSRTPTANTPCMAISRPEACPLRRGRESHAAQQILGLLSDTGDAASPTSIRSRRSDPLHARSIPFRFSEPPRGRP